MTIQEFATKYRFNTRIDKDDGTTIVPGVPHGIGTK